jgi:hypothetical protein
MNNKLLRGKEVADQLGIIKAFTNRLMIKGAIRGVRHERSNSIIFINCKGFNIRNLITSENFEEKGKLIHPNDQIDEVDNGK